jgi:hypothetical protein
MPLLKARSKSTEEIVSSNKEYNLRRAGSKTKRNAPELTTELH